MHPVAAPGPGTLLVASPVLRDPNFVRTVVLLCEHGDAGSWGLVLNRRTALTFGELLEDLPFPAAAQGPVFWGGPVEPSRMQVLHRLRQAPAGELEVVPNVSLGMDADRFRALAAESLLPGEALRAYVGHAGWGPGQLESEIEGGSWILSSADDHAVFDVPADGLWQHVLSALGPSFARLVEVPLDPRVN